MSRWTLVNSCFGFQTLLRRKVSGCGEGGLSNPKSDTGVACALTHGVQLHSLWIWRLLLICQQPLAQQWWAMARDSGQEQKTRERAGGGTCARNPCRDRLPGVLAASRWGQRRSWSPALLQSHRGRDWYPLDELKGVPGPGQVGQGHSGTVLISGSDNRLSKSALNKCKGLVS